MYNSTGTRVLHVLSVRGLHNISFQVEKDAFWCGQQQHLKTQQPKTEATPQIESVV
jgi:hypothetical protein